MQIDDTNLQFDQIAAEYVDRIHEGETPDVDDYIQRFPEHAGRIAELFPMIATIEGSKRKTAKRESLPIEYLNDFRIIREIGRGGMGIVYEAEQQSLGRRVALKVLPRQMLLKEQNLRRFRREAKTAANLHHPSIVPVLGVGDCDGYHYYVMQFIDGAPLDEIIMRIRDLVYDTSRSPVEGQRGHAGENGSEAAGCSSGFASVNSAAGLLLNVDTTTVSSGVSARSLSDHTQTAGQTVNDLSIADSAIKPKQFHGEPDKHELSGPYWRNVARIGVEAASAVDYAHGQGVLHRDIKPGNILIDQQGSSWLADFGLAKSIDQDAVSQTGDVLGTLRYMSPEQSRGESDQRGDVYSLGVALYELLTLKSAFAEIRLPRTVDDSLPTPPSRVHAGVPRDLETIVMKSIEARADLRYQTASELANDLQRFLEDKPIAARRASYGERLVRWCRKNPALAALTAIATMLLVTIVTLSINGHVKTRALLVSQSEQREKAESTLKISLETLDKIYDQFAPTSVFESTNQSLDGADLPEITQPVVSRDTAAFLESLLTIYDQYAALDSKDLKLKIDSARARKRVGDIRLRLGEYPEAEAAYSKSLEDFETLSELENGDEPLDLYAAQIQNQLGLVRLFSGDRHEARQYHMAAYEILSRNDLDDVKFGNAMKLELARSCLQLGKKPDPLQGPPPEPGVSKGGRHRGRDSGSDARRPPPSAGALPGNGPLAGGGRGFGQGQPHENPPHRRPRREMEISYLDEGIELLRELLAETPRSAEPRLLLARCLKERAKNSDSEEIEEALSLLNDLVVENPKISDFRLELSETLAQGDFRRVPTQQLKLYEERLSRALEISSDLDETTPAHALSQIHVRHKLARVRFDQLWEQPPPHDPLEIEQIRELVHESVEQQAELSRRFPEMIPYKVWELELSLSLLEITVTPRQNRDQKRAQELCDEIQKQLDRLQHNPETAGFSKSRRQRFERLAARIESD